MPELKKAASRETPAKPTYLAVGRLLRPHGLRGEMLMEILTDFPERLRPGALVYLGEQHQAVRIASCRGDPHRFLIRFEPYTDVDQVGGLRNQICYAAAADLPALAADEYYVHQLLGLKVVSDEGQELGQIETILETGANDVLLVRAPSGAEILLPHIDPVVLNIDLEQGQMLVHLLPGLLPD